MVGLPHAATVYIKVLYWIAGLSLINSIIHLCGAQLSFIVGFGVTQIVDGIGMGAIEAAGEEHRMLISGIVFGVNLVSAAWFVLWGVLAGKAKRWAYIVGMVFYALDGLIFLLAMDLLSIGFHVFALVQIFRGFKACGALLEVHAQMKANEAESVPVDAPFPEPEQPA